MAKMHFAPSRQGARFFWTLELRSPVADGVSLAVDIRNGINQAFHLGFVAGLRAFVCDNPSFRPELLVSREHMPNGCARFREAIALAVGELETSRVVESRRVGPMQAAGLADVEAESLMLRACDHDIVSLRLLPNVIRVWREPSHEEFQPRTVWSLYNAFIGALAGRARSNPQLYADLTMQIAALTAPIEAEAN